MEHQASDLVRPPKAVPTQPVSRAVTRLTKFFRRRPIDPSRVEAMRGTVRGGIAAVGVAAVVAVGVAGCSQSDRSEGSPGYGYPVVEPPTSILPPQVLGGDRVYGRYEWWEESSDRPGALFLGDAEGGDGYEINWFRDDLDAPIPISPQVLYQDLPAGTELTVDAFGNVYPVDRRVREAYMATEFELSIVELERPADTLCVDVDFRLRNGNEGSAGTFVVDPQAGRGYRVATTDGEPCPSERSSTESISVVEIGPGR